MSNNYPKEIYYYDPLNWKLMCERAYDIGREHAKQESTTEPEWFNLTEAIASGADIEWEKLDGVKARCAHAEIGTLTYKLERDSDEPEDSPWGWFHIGAPKAWDTAFACAWGGKYDWTLYIDHPGPLKRKTADQLEPGTCFVGKTTTDDALCYCIRYTGASGKALAVHISSGTVSPAKKFTVLEERGIGTFKAVDDEA